MASTSEPAIEAAGLIKTFGATRAVDGLNLDEPTAGLDPRSRKQVWDIVRALVRTGTTVLLTTQYLDEADQLADRIAVIDHGRIIAEGTPAQLKATVGSGALHVRVVDEARRPEAERLLTEALGTPVRPTADGAALSARVNDPERVALALAELTRARIQAARGGRCDLQGCAL
jgi:ABC-2 type transport system ATP-binding protein